MKPLEVPNTVETEGEMECELHSKEFFVQVGILVIEGRTPEHSERGRIEGKHCVGLKGNVNHVCDVKAKQCKEALSWIKLMEHHWHSTSPIVIDVLVQLADKMDSVILLEQWTISIVNSCSNSHSTSGSLLLQAVRSHIHFSQLSAWLSLTKGSLPYNIQCRMNHQSDTATFIQGPLQHMFPLASLPDHLSLQVMVKSLPRYSIQELIETLECEAENLCCNNLKTQDKDSFGEINDSPSWEADTRSPLRKRTCLKKIANETLPSCSKMKDLVASCATSTDLESEFLRLDTGERSSVSSKISEKEIVGSNFMNLGASCSNSGSNGIGNLNERIQRLGRDIENIDRSINKKDRTLSGLTKLLKESSSSSREDIKESPKESSNESIFEEKARVLCAKERTNWDSGDMTKTLLNRKCHSLSERGVRVDSLQSNHGAASKEANTKSTPTRQGTASNSSDVDIHAIRQTVDRACFRRSVQLPIGACTEPVFNPKTGLPISSSPAPLRRSTNELYEDTADFTDGLSNKIDYRELSKLLSRSAPASTTQSLLVNFEESVLNGRMEPVGTVEGFTAELSASGSFCPRHVKLPIISCFYRLSDDDAPSPYMGYISLKRESLGRRGYHIPKYGTIQLTVFNPNKTVVKMFVVMYDCSDMPPRSQTFLRQKTYSALKGNVVKNEVQQTLHYLVHLRFASSKSGKIHLHTDIRVIFARQPPDLGHLYQLYTITDGPTDPKYTKRHHMSMDPEY